MAILTVQRPGIGGATLTLTAAASGGDSFRNTGVESFEITNAHASASRTVTFDSPGTCSFGLSANAAHDAVITVAAMTTKIIGPFPTGRFNDTNGRVQVTYSDSAADLSVAVVKT
jgi:hypothetical protein